MTWHTFFNLSTLESRHLLASYAVVLVLQGGYFAWVVARWMSPPSRQGRRQPD